MNFKGSPRRNYFAVFASAMLVVGYANGVDLAKDGKSASSIGLEQNTAAMQLPSPVFETRFELNQAGGVIDAVSPDAPGKISGKKVEIVDSVLGKAARFEADSASNITFPNTANVATPEDFTASVWFNATDYPIPDVERSRRRYGILCRGWQFYGIIGEKGDVNFNALQLFPLVGPDKVVMHGQWTHAAYTYSVSAKRYELFVNGQKVASRSLNLE